MSLPWRRNHLLEISKLPHTLRKQGSKAATSSSKNGATPSKVQKELEADDAETTASTGLSEATFWTAQF